MVIFVCPLMVIFVCPLMVIFVCPLMVIFVCPLMATTSSLFLKSGTEQKSALKSGRHDQ